MFVVDASSTQPRINETCLAGLRVLLPAGETRQNSADMMSPRFRVSRRIYATPLVPWSAPELPPVGAGSSRPTNILSTPRQ